MATDAMAVKNTVSWTSGLNILAGIWLFISPWVLSYQGINVALWNNLIVGAAIAVLALSRVSTPDRHGEVSWFNLLLGAWLFFAPFWMAYHPVAPDIPHVNYLGAFWNDIIMGIVVFFLAGASALATGKLNKP